MPKCKTCQNVAAFDDQTEDSLCPFSHLLPPSTLQLYLNDSNEPVEEVSDDVLPPLASLDRYRQWYRFEPDNCLHKEAARNKTESLKKPPEKSKKKKTTAQLTKLIHEEGQFGVLHYPLEQLWQQYLPYRFFVQDWTKLDWVNNSRLAGLELGLTSWRNVVRYLQLWPHFSQLAAADVRLLTEYFFPDVPAMNSILTAKRTAPAGDVLSESVAPSDDEFLWELVDSFGNSMTFPAVTGCEHFGYGELIDMIVKTFRAFTKFWQGDLLLISLTVGVLFYNPDRPGLTEKSKVWNTQQIYFNLIKRYFANRYRSSQDASMAFLLFIEILSRIRVISKKVLSITSKFEELSLSPEVAHLLEIQTSNE